MRLLLDPFRIGMAVGVLFGILLVLAWPGSV